MSDRELIVWKGKQYELIKRATADDGEPVVLIRRVDGRKWFHQKIRIIPAREMDQLAE